MNYLHPEISAPIDQGDVIRDCPLVTIQKWDPGSPVEPETRCFRSRVVVLTQTCDLALGKATRAIVAVAFPAEELIAQGQLSAAEIRGPVRSARVFGWYFLQSDNAVGMPELIVHLRMIHTVPLEVLLELCAAGNREVRIPPLYREHLAKHFADTYARIGLPEPYPSE